MTKEEFIKALEENVNIAELTKDHAYILQIEVGDMPKEQVAKLLTRFAEKLTNLGISNFIFVPTNKNYGSLTFYEVEDGKIKAI